MNNYPIHFEQYPNMNTSLPIHFSLNRLKNGYPSHRHNFLEFSYVVEGNGSESINGVRHPMMPGTFTFVLPYQVHELFTDPGSKLILYNCMFSMDVILEQQIGLDKVLSSLFDDQAESTPFVQIENDESKVMKAILDDMYTEFHGDNWGRGSLLKVRLREVLIRFHRARKSQDLGVTFGKSNASGGKRERNIWSIINYIHSHYREEELQLSQVAAHFSLSVSRMSEWIKRATGQTYLRLVQDLRIRYAASLLLSTDMSMTEIAHEVGYGSYKTFVRIFREHNGVAPMEYRKRKAQI